MAETSGTGLTRLQARIEENFEAVIGGMEKQRATQRVMLEIVRMILERLTPGESEAPTIGKLPVS